MDKVDQIATETNLIAYVPALSRRYLDFFKKFKGSKLNVLGPNMLDSLSEEVPYVGPNGRDLWALKPQEAKNIASSLNIFSQVSVLDSEDQLPDEGESVHLPDDDVSQAFVEKYLPTHNNVELVRSRLRWDRMAAFNEEPPADFVSITTEEMHKDFMNSSYEWSEKSFDWWRQTSAVIVKNGELLVGATNREHPALIFDMMGDSRTPFNAGEHVDKVLTTHAERAAITQAAREGTALEGADIYVSVFPCRECAAAIIQAGINRLFFATGSSRLEAAELLRVNDIEIIKVDM